MKEKIPLLTGFQPFADSEALPHVIGIEVAGQAHSCAIGCNKILFK
jgi:hypothetical protein